MARTVGERTVVDCLIRFQACLRVTTSAKVRPVADAIFLSALDCSSVAGRLLHSSRVAWLRSRRLFFRWTSLIFCCSGVIVAAFLLRGGENRSGQAGGSLLGSLASSVLRRV